MEEKPSEAILYFLFLFLFFLSLIYYTRPYYLTLPRLATSYSPAFVCLVVLSAKYSRPLLGKSKNYNLY